jgi:glyoxylase I family protein
MARPAFIDHLVFRISALDKTERFYTALLDQPTHRTEDSITYSVGDTLLFFTTSPKSQIGTYDKEKIGLNHIAFGVRTLTELETIREQLDGHEIAHSGIKLDSYGPTEFIWLDDPDGLRIEFYLRPEA